MNTTPLRAATACFILSVCSASGATLCVNPAGTAGCVNSIGAAMLLASPNDTIQVGPGTYKETIVITKSLTLMGMNRQTVIIDATGRSNGLYVDGIDNANLSNVNISGLTVKNANFEGILVTNSTGVLIQNNVVTNNDKSLNVSAGTCPGQPAFETSEGDDCGEGVHLIGVDHSTVSGNLVQFNAGGILISDETAPNHDNLIIGNSVIDNPYDCGITLASHPQAGTLKAPQGVYHITVSGNTSEYNGVITSGGAGVGIFTPSPGTMAYGNVVIGNTLMGNGMTGVALHSHAPDQTLADNMIIGNHISDNGPDDSTSAPTGIAAIGLLAAAGTSLPIPGLVISGNVIENEGIDIAIQNTSPAWVHDNTLSGGAGVVGLQNLGSGAIDATQNWWGCAAGPTDATCSSIAGTGVLTSPSTAQPGQSAIGPVFR